MLHLFSLSHEAAADDVELPCSKGAEPAEQLSLLKAEPKAAAAPSYRAAKVDVQGRALIGESLTPIPITLS